MIPKEVHDLIGQVKLIDVLIWCAVGLFAIRILWKSRGGLRRFLRVMDVVEDLPEMNAKVDENTKRLDGLDDRLDRIETAIGIRATD